jgi:hypothetical protein
MFDWGYGWPAGLFSDEFVWYSLAFISYKTDILISQTDSWVILSIGSELLGGRSSCERLCEALNYKACCCVIHSARCQGRERDGEELEKSVSLSFSFQFFPP